MRFIESGIPHDRYKYVLLLMCWLGLFYICLNRNIVSSVLPSLMDEFGLSYTTAGFLISALILTHASLQLPSGYLADRFSKRKLIVLCTIAYSSVTTITGLFSSSYLLLVIFQVLMGVSGSFFFISAQSLVVENFSPEKRGKALGIWITAFPSSILAAALVFPMLTKMSGWRTPYVLSGLFGFVVVFVLWKMIKEPKRVSSDYTGSFSSVVRNPLINRLVIIGFFLTQIVGFSSLLPTFLVKEYELDLTMAGLLWSITPIASILGSIVGGSLCDAFKKRTILILTSSFSSAILLSLFMFSKVLFLVLAVLIFVIVAERIAEMATTTLVANLTKNGKRGKILSYFNMAGIGSMGFSTSIIGLMADNFGYASIFAFLSSTMLFSSIFSMTIPVECQNSGTDQ